MSSHYDLQAIREQPRKRDHWAVSLDLVMSRLNALEAYAGQPLSTWYGTDPETGTFYGTPTLSEYAHLRITYAGAGARAYIRERVDYLRQVIGAPVFPWAYTPSLDDFDNEPHRRCGVDAKALLEMLQAIGRAASGATYTHYYRRINNGVTTEWNNQGQSYARASYLYDYNILSTNTYGRITAVAGVDLSLNFYSSTSGELGPVKVRDNTLDIKIGWSKQEDSGSPEEKDWVETEGEHLVMFINSTGGGGNGTITGSYIYGWYDGYSYELKCHGGQVYTQHQYHINKSPSDYKEGGSMVRKRTFSPQFSYGINGLVYPVEYTIDMFRGEDGIPRKITELMGLINLSGARTHVNVSHLMSYDPGLNEEGKQLAWSATAEYCALIHSREKGTIETLYIQDEKKSGWLLWTAPYIPENYTERLAI